ncbi:MAG: efflux transporter outer membrane subunit [Proteobacteria bacterium]|nr:efflux transporter outer membrane subunit [Pseudomonadota bacterium]
MKFRKYSPTILGIILLIPLFFQGCATVGPDFTPPKVETPDRFAHALETDAKTISDLKWWELFDDPILFQLVTTALENNRNAKIALSSIEQARAELGYYQADQYPAIGLQGGGSTGNYGGARSTITTGNAYIAPMLNWELDFWGKFKRSTESAKARLLASEYGIRTIQIGLITDVVSTYYLLLDYHQRLKISRETLVSRTKSLDIIQMRFDKGIIPEIDVNQAQIQKAIAAGSIPKYERAIGNAENALGILMGQLPRQIQSGQPLDLQSVPPFIPGFLPSRLLERRPEIGEAMALLKAQNEQIGIAVAQRFPSISLTGLLGVASSDLGSITTSGGIWSVGASLVSPLFDFDKSKRKVDIETEKTKQALYTYENIVLTAFSEVEDALIEIETYHRELTATQQKVAAAQNANALSYERYDKGVSSYLEALDSERTLFDAQLELSELKRNYFNAYVKLYKSLGGGWLYETEGKAPPGN